MVRNVKWALAIAAASGGLLSSSAIAQVSAPPRHDTRSETGVSYRDGSFKWNEQDLSIGDDNGLSLSRVYLSSSQDGVFSPGWTHNLFSFVRNEAVPLYPDTSPPPAHLLPRGRAASC